MANRKNKGNDMSDNYAMQISVGFTDADVREAMPHLKGAAACVALESIELLLQSYVYEAGCEIISQLLREEGWDINGESFIEMGGW
jgi:hypothetical protein